MSAFPQRRPCRRRRVFTPTSLAWSRLLRARRRAMIMPPTLQKLNEFTLAVYVLHTVADKLLDPSDIVLSRHSKIVEGLGKQSRS